MKKHFSLLTWKDCHNLLLNLKKKKKKAKYNEGGKVFSINGAEGLSWGSSG